MRLPEGFVFGTSTASYQIEGAVKEDGRGRSIWDTFSHTEGKTLDGDTGDVACDHYHRYSEDVALMKRLGVGGYRFSLAWPRIQPTGRGPANEAGLDFYDRLVDELLVADIAPMATLYHWDLPQALEDEGGWYSRDIVERFADYTEIVAGRLGDRVTHWCPVNEPNVFTLFGYALGMHAPGKADLFGALPACHHANLAHGRAVQVLRAATNGQVGTANNHAPMWPDSDSQEDRDAAAGMDALWNGLFADPMLLGRYPEDLAELMPIEDGDLETIHQPLDFYGVNYYNPQQIKAGTGDVPFDQCEITGYPTSDFGWPVVPAGLTKLLVTLKERYPDLPPVMITENGTSFAAIDDQFRIDYLDSHLGAVADAIEQGVDVAGYYCWSLLDNFEWAEGYSQRFGLVHVDFDSPGLTRTPRRSFDWYSNLIRRHG